MACEFWEVKMTGEFYDCPAHRNRPLRSFLKEGREGQLCPVAGCTFRFYADEGYDDAIARWAEGLPLAELMKFLKENEELCRRFKDLRNLRGKK